MPSEGSALDDVELLHGRAAPWGRVALVLLAASMLVAVGLRCYGLAADGFADDEVHKWLAANRYLTGDFGGDDLEHPMLMKVLIAACIAALPRSWPPEMLTRLPNALAGGALVLAVALLGRRLFGRATGLLAGALTSVSVTLVGYNRIAKEDTLLTLFLVLLLWCLAEGHAAASDGAPAAARRWETAGACAAGLMLASKYFIFHALIPVFAYAALRAAGSSWVVPSRRWVRLSAEALLVFAAVNFAFFRPSTWAYLSSYLHRDPIADRWTSESLSFMGRSYWNFGFHYRGGIPWWFHLVFAAVKLAPITFLLSCAGLGLAVWRRRPAHIILLVWMMTWLAIFVVGVAKFGRFFLSVMPAFLLLACHAAVVLAERFRRRVPDSAAAPASRWLGTRLVAPGAAAAVLLVPEAWAAVQHAPHYRLYVNALGGGDEKVGYYFPHCDFYDAGVREAVAAIAARAEPGAEVASDVEWPVRYYVSELGRGDIVTSQLRRERACLQHRICYVVVQSGRRYFHNEAALDALAPRPPWHEQRVAGHAAVKVYRLGPGEHLFP